MPQHPQGFPCSALKASHQTQDHFWVSLGSNSSCRYWLSTLGPSFVVWGFSLEYHNFLLFPLPWLLMCMSFFFSFLSKLRESIWEDVFESFFAPIWSICVMKLQDSSSFAPGEKRENPKNTAANTLQRLLFKSLTPGCLQWVKQGCRFCQRSGFFWTLHGACPSSCQCWLTMSW